MAHTPASLLDKITYIGLTRFRHPPIDLCRLRYLLFKRIGNPNQRAGDCAFHLDPPREGFGTMRGQTRISVVYVPSHQSQPTSRPNHLFGL